MSLSFIVTGTILRLMLAVAAAPVVIVFVLLSRSFIRGLLGGAVKEYGQPPGRFPVPPHH